MCAFDTQHSKVAALVAQHDVGVELPFVGQRHLTLTRAPDDVEIGDDRPAGSTMTPEPSERWTWRRGTAPKKWRKNGSAINGFWFSTTWVA